MIISLLSIFLSANLIYVANYLFQYAQTDKHLLFTDYYDSETLKKIELIDQINGVLHPILDQLVHRPDLRVYRFVDTTNCPIEQTKEQCSLDTCNMKIDDEFAAIKNVDLQYTGEKYTGNQGQTVWLNIYEDLGKYNQTELHTYFVQLIKGIHSSISVAITEQFEGANNTKPNVDFFFWRVGYYPDRIFNLYFLHQFLLESSKFLKFDHLELQSDTKALLQTFFTTYKTLPNLPFTYFQNMTQIDLQIYYEDIQLLQNYMDCVQCNRCKVNGKLQIHGLKIGIESLFDEQFRYLDERNDLVAFINTFSKISSSVNSIEKMFLRRQYQYISNVRIGLLSSIILIVFSFLIRKFTNK